MPVGNTLSLVSFKSTELRSAQPCSPNKNICSIKKYLNSRNCLFEMYRISVSKSQLYHLYAHFHMMISSRDWSSF